MIEFYPQIKMIHVYAVVISGLLFLLRGGAWLTGARWPKNAVVRYTSYTIDTILLTAAFMLFTMLPKTMFTNGWLLVKIVVLVAYIALGIQAFRTKYGTKKQAMFFCLAVFAYVFMIGAARMHHPLGWFVTL